MKKENTNYERVAVVKLEKSKRCYHYGIPNQDKTHYVPGDIVLVTTDTEDKYDVQVISEIITAEEEKKYEGYYEGITQEVWSLVPNVIDIKDYYKDKDAFAFLISNLQKVYTNLYNDPDYSIENMMK
jgi:hypothetical protein